MMTTTLTSSTAKATEARTEIESPTQSVDTTTTAAAAAAAAPSSIATPDDTISNNNNHSPNNANTNDTISAVADDHHNHNTIHRQEDYDEDGHEHEYEYEHGHDDGGNGDGDGDCRDDDDDMNHPYMSFYTMAKVASPVPAPPVPKITIEKYNNNNKINASTTRMTTKIAMGEEKEGVAGTVAGNEQQQRRRKLRRTSLATATEVTETKPELTEGNNKQLPTATTTAIMGREGKGEEEGEEESVGTKSENEQQIIRESGGIERRKEEGSTATTRKRRRTSLSYRYQYSSDSDSDCNDDNIATITTTTNITTSSTVRNTGINKNIKTTIDGIGMDRDEIVIGMDDDDYDDYDDQTYVDEDDDKDGNEDEGKEDDNNFNVSNYTIQTNNRTKNTKKPKADKKKKKNIHSGLQIRAILQQPYQKMRCEAKTMRHKEALHTWFCRFNDLLEFKETNHGSTNVPQQYLANRFLGIWVNKQRMEKRAKDAGKNSSMTDPKIKLLEGIGFVWAKEKGQAAWEDKFQELQDYKQLHGNCTVPTKNATNRALGRWVSTQRAVYKRFIKTGELAYPRMNIKEMNQRISRLNGLNFSWYEGIGSNNNSSNSSNDISI